MINWTHAFIFSAYFGVLAVAIQEGHSIDWALNRVGELGFEVTPEAQPDVYKMYCESLGSRPGMDREEL